MLHSAKGLVTNFQLKSAKSSEILLKRWQCQYDQKKPIKLYNILIFRLAIAFCKHGLKMPVFANTLFGPQCSIRQHFEFLSNVTGACLVFCIIHSSWRSHSNGCMFVCSRKMLSDKQSDYSFSPTNKPVVLNFVLH